MSIQTGSGGEAVNPNDKGVVGGQSGGPTEYRGPVHIEKDGGGSGEGTAHMTVMTDQGGVFWKGGLFGETAALESANIVTMLDYKPFFPQDPKQNKFEIDGASGSQGGFMEIDRGVPCD